MSSAPDSRRFDFDDTSNTINFADYDDDSDGTILGDDEFEEQFVRATPDVTFMGASTRQPDPDPDPDHNVWRLNSYSSGGRTFKPGKTVELDDGDFLRMTAIVEAPMTGTISLKGVRFRRNKELNGLLEFKRNEVTMCPDFDNTNPSISLSKVVKIRELVKTNAPFPTHSFREIDPTWQTQGKDNILNHGRLVCRTQVLQVDKNEGWLKVLDRAETDNGFGVDPEQLRHSFRGATLRGGECRAWLNGEKEFDAAERERSRGLDLLHFHRQNASLPSGETGARYTFGDGFCGAGGASRGAKAAGYRVDWGYDFDPAAVISYQRNFFGTRCEAIAAHEFVTVIGEEFRVDVLHLSPPCQTFSPIHVRPGQNDELNQATFFAIEGLIQKVKPRIVTLEETFGLTRNLEHLPWFRAMIQVFTKLGFSVRWKVFSLAELGLPQPRKRLILFASCPGETLPEYPKPTHCKAADVHRFPNLSPFATVRDAISRIPNDFDLHNPERLPERNDPPYSADLPLRNTIVCTAQGQSWHPSGKRLFTLREIASLQGFPEEHLFGPVRARRQMGNAFPPIASKAFFECIGEALLKADGLI